MLAKQEMGGADVEIVAPSVSILAEPSVAVVDRNVDKHGTRAVAEAYLKFLYSPQGQEIAARNHYRPRSAQVMAKYANQFPEVHLFTLKDMFGNWNQVNAKFFADGAVFDQIGPGT
jgi:sulfate transport system substrate-binding protein